MKKRIRIEDVAKKAGLSTATVSRYINQSAAVSDKNAQIIRSVIEDLNYVPNVAAQILASQRTMTIGLVFPSLASSFFSSLLRGIETRASKDDFALLIHSTEIPSKGTKTRRVLGEQNTDGIIVFSDSLDEEELKRLADIGFPVVLIYRSSPTFLNLPSVTIENKDGVYKLVSHLIEVHNCQNIAFLRGPEKHENAYWREAGYRKALMDHKIPYNPDLVENGEFNTEQARLGVRRLLDRKVKFDAIFAGDDDAASGSMMELRESGLLIPQDVAVVGFDDQSIALHLSPSLTTIHSPIEEVGFQATDKLIRLIGGKSVETQTLLPTELIIRRSCGCTN
ncbi:MAG: LacI family DNA-binding transcriptional regulator [Anaerolineaceae bacterium]